MFVYKLENGRYYCSNDSIDEITKITFCKIFRPLSLIETIHCRDKIDEEKCIIRYMRRYGVNNVRGAEYNDTEYNLSEIIELRRKLGFDRIFKEPVYDIDENVD